MTPIDITAQGMTMPALGFGTYRLTGQACREAVATAIGAGYRHIDTARFYANEADIGQGIRDAGIDRDALFITTKVWRTSLAEGDVQSSVEASLRDLGTHTIDLLLIHWPSQSVPVAETLGAMLTLQREGKVRHIGVSNFTIAQLEEARRYATIVCNQVEHHPWLTQKPLLDAMRGWDMALVAYCPLVRGHILTDPTLEDIAAAHGKSPAQIALRWFVQRPGVGAVPKATSKDHIQSNLDIFDFNLTPEELARIDAMNRGHRITQVSWAPDWDPS